MKQLLLIFAVVGLVGCGESAEEKAAKAKAATEEAKAKAGAWVSDPNDPNNVKIEKVIRKAVKKPTGELTKLDLEKVRELNLFNKGLTNVKGLEKLTNLMRLPLQNNKLTNITQLEKLTKLTTLWLFNNQLTDVPKGLGNLTQLTNLQLSNNRLTEIKGLEKLTQLKGLELSSNRLTDVKGLEKLTQLTYLKLGGNQLTEVPKGLENLTQLMSLSLGGNQLTEAPQGLEKLTQLKTLSLAKNQLTDVKGLENLTQLKELYLDRNKLTDVTGLEKLTQLQSLNLEDNPDLPKEKIDQLKKAVSGWRISHDYSTNAEKIEKEIRNNEYNPSFKKLTGELTKADLEKVTHLSLRGRKLTDVTGLEKLTNLKRLSLDKNPDLTKAQIDQLQKALPKCRIDSDFYEGKVLRIRF